MIRVRTLEKFIPWYERTDVCKHGDEYKMCADCQTEDYVTELWRLQDKRKSNTNNNTSSQLLMFGFYIPDSTITEKLYSDEDYEEAKKQGYDLDDWNDYVRFYGIGEEPNYDDM
jgi:hypothetical protein